MPERSYFIRGYQFPVCARCMGVLLGYGIGLAGLFWGLLDPEICVGACLVMFLDWYIQYKGIRSSNNLRRLITGAICGVGYFHLLAHGICRIGGYLNTIKMI